MIVNSPLVASSEVSFLTLLCSFDLLLSHSSKSFQLQISLCAMSYFVHLRNKINDMPDKSEGRWKKLKLPVKQRPHNKKNIHIQALPGYFVTTFRTWSSRSAKNRDFLSTSFGASHKNLSRSFSRKRDVTLKLKNKQTNSVEGSQCKLYNICT